MLSHTYISLHTLSFPPGDGTKTGTSGALYKPTSTIMQKLEEKKGKETEKLIVSTAGGVNNKPLVCAWYCYMVLMILCGPLCSERRAQKKRRVS